MIMTDWDSITLVAGIVGLGAAFFFLASYFRRAGVDAWRNPFGRYLIIRKILLSFLFLAAILNRVAQDSAWWREVQEPWMAILISALALQVMWPYRLLLKAQEEAQQKEESRS
jgi:O-antigen ligase